MQKISIKHDDLSSPEIHALLREHMAGMMRESPPESVHALDLSGLRMPEITFWSAWEGSQLLGCGALKELNAQHGEIKSMRTAAQHLRKGVAQKMLQHIIEEAKRRTYRRLSLETGTTQGFAPARLLYAKCGFTECAPFSDYRLDPFSVFMSKTL